MNRYKIVPILGLAIMSGFHALADDDNNKRDKKKKRNAEQEQLVQEPDTLVMPIPNNRLLFTDKVDKALRAIDAKDGNVDGLVDNADPIKSKLLSQSYLELGKKLKIKIENADISHPRKIGYHKALEDKLRAFARENTEKVDAVHHRQLMTNFSGMLLADMKGEGLDFVKKNPDLYSLENIDLLAQNPEAKAYVYRNVGLQYPEMMLSLLNKIANEPYTDEIVSAAAKEAPGTVMSYAAPASKYGYIIRRNQDKLVQSIVAIADKSKQPFKVLPFLNQINSGEQSIAEIDKVAQSEDAYFKALVALKISGQSTSVKAIEDEIAYRALAYVRKVNELHDKPDAVRFKSIEAFSPEEYYFMLLGGETNEIYTSSYLGIFKRMMAKMDKASGYALMQKVRMSNFRTFIRMAAGYNTASTFLNSMSEEERTTLLRDFVAGLEKGSRSDLKDAVDVADAFGSLTEKPLLAFLKGEVKSNYERVYQDKSLNAQAQEKGVIVYGLLASIFNSSENPDQLQHAVDNIPPINFVDRKGLLNDKGAIVAQVFFYGDEDGVVSYSSFLSSFRNKNWKIDESNKDWITVTSTTGNPITYYANRPLKEPADETAQNKLAAYFAANDIVPSVVIHRGHSYHLEGSLKNLSPDVKVVMLGSCGGFHNLANVLDKSPDAHIISTKQIGAMAINEPIIRGMNEYFVGDKNLNWIDLWKSLGTYFEKRPNHEKELFSDYIPPNKNLGAIFIKAYRKIEMSNQS